jgi:hypothetical protein
MTKRASDRQNGGRSSGYQNGSTRPPARNPRRPGILAGLFSTTIALFFLLTLFVPTIAETHAVLSITSTEWVTLLCVAALWINFMRHARQDLKDGIADAIDGAVIAFRGGERLLRRLSIRVRSSSADSLSVHSVLAKILLVSIVCALGTCGDTPQVQNVPADPAQKTVVNNLLSPIPIGPPQRFESPIEQAPPPVAYDVPLPRRRPLDLAGTPQRKGGTHFARRMPLLLVRPKQLPPLAPVISAYQPAVFPVNCYSFFLLFMSSSEQAACGIIPLGPPPPQESSDRSIY